jgi:hypothetical protein
VIASPIRLTATSRTSSATAGAPPEAADGDPVETATDIETRIAALVARATTPEDEALERQREEFDLVTRIRAESDREVNALRDMAMEQMKHEDELLKKWIALI